MRICVRKAEGSNNARRLAHEIARRIVRRGAEEPVKALSLSLSLLIARRSIATRSPPPPPPFLIDIVIVITSPGDFTLVTRAKELLAFIKYHSHNINTVEWNSSNLTLLIRIF